jgi:hypothetical protein
MWGGVTGMKIIRAIVDGTRDPRCSPSTATCDAGLARDDSRGLDGNYRTEHVFALGQLSNSTSSTR